MKKIDFPMILDIAFYSFSVWIFSLVILRYYRLPVWLCFIVCTLLALATGGIAFLVIYRKHRQIRLSRKEQQKKDALMLHLTLEKAERVRSALLAAFAKDGKDAHCMNDYLQIDGVTAVPLFTMQPVSADAVALILRDFGKEPFLLLCNALSPEAEKLLKDFGRKSMKGAEVYALFEKTGTTPDPLICAEIPRMTARKRIERAFSKKNARPFFVSGLLLLIMSLFTFFPTYYIVTGSVLLLSSVFIRAFGYVQA